MDYSQYTDRLKVCFWDDYVRDKKTRNPMIPAYFKELLESRDEIEEMIDSNKSFHLISGGRLSGKSSVLQYITLRRAIKTEGNHYYITTDKRMAKVELLYIYNWIKLIGMEQQIILFEDGQLKLHNGASIIMQSTQSVKSVPSFVTMVFDQIDFFSKDYIAKLLIPLFFEPHNGTLFFTCARPTKDTGMYAQVGLGLKVEYANEVDILMRTNKLTEKALSLIENVLNQRGQSLV